MDEDEFQAPDTIKTQCIFCSAEAPDEVCPLRCAIYDPPLPLYIAQFYSSGPALREAIDWLDADADLFFEVLRRWKEWPYELAAELDKYGRVANLRPNCDVDAMLFLRAHTAIVVAWMDDKGISGGERVYEAAQLIEAYSLTFEDDPELPSRSQEIYHALRFLDAQYSRLQSIYAVLRTRMLDEEMKKGNETPIEHLKNELAEIRNIVRKTGEYTELKQRDVARMIMEAFPNVKKELEDWETHVHRAVNHPYKNPDRKLPKTGPFILRRDAEAWIYRELKRDWESENELDADEW